MLGFDLTNRSLYDMLYPIVANQRVIAINQDWAGSAGTLVANSSTYFEAPTVHGASGKLRPGNKSDISFPEWQVWRKPLSNGAQAVLIINIDTQPHTVQVSFAELGLGGRKIAATDAWTGQTVAVGEKGLDLGTITGHGSVFLLLTGAQELDTM